ncbi:DUF3558 domain-containing protein [Nocardia blacklockiae]|uniref:DUF3558 domain-containing protein n=1 Tax=Nocardia blacklockiae TaxID=480036 RepID=UPI00189519EC|nr:DUF3558 domain-containing protein [Nocardia blacklockiae]MBF6172768.1 DUF3558 domain-containing protein [Nocardia blacklockiae]
MRITSAIVLGAALATLLTACGSGDDSGSASPAVRPPLKVATLGPFTGECGGLTDDEVRDLGRLPQISRSFKNSVGCNWQSAGAGSPSVTFASYRGSPIERERAWVTAQGRNPESIEVAGHQGFQDATADGSICDLAVQLGDDFFEWSTSAGLFGQLGGDPCAKNRKMAELTVQRLK